MPASKQTYIDKVRPETISPECNNLFLTQGGKPITVNTVKMLFSRILRDQECKDCMPIGAGIPSQLITYSTAGISFLYGRYLVIPPWIW
jgi:hypothetical protein